MNTAMRIFISLFVIFFGLFAVSAHEGATGPTKARMDAMSDMGRALKTLTLAARGGRVLNDPAMEASIKILQQKSATLPALFAKQEIPANSDALPSIWDDPKGFEQSIAAYMVATDRLGVAYKAGDNDGLLRALRGAAGTCNTCHRSFRK